MLKRLSMLALLLTLGFGFSGCRLAGPPMANACGNNCTNCDGDKTCKMLNQWGRDAKKSERAIDHLFFNYDINDPYRGDCLVGN